MTKVAGELSTEQAAVLLGLSEWAMRRRLRAVDRRFGKGTVPRRGDSPRGWYRLTEPWLRKYLPDRFNRRDEGAEFISKQLEALWERVQLQDEQIEGVVALVALTQTALDAHINRAI